MRHARELAQGALTRATIRKGAEQGGEQRVPPAEPAEIVRVLDTLWAAASPSIHRWRRPGSRRKLTQKPSSVFQREAKWVRVSRAADVRRQ